MLGYQVRQQGERLLLVLGSTRAQGSADTRFAIVQSHGASHSPCHWPEHVQR